jgi:hypothetical protein
MKNFIYNLFSEEQVTELLKRQQQITFYYSEIEIIEARIEKQKLIELIKEYLDKNNIGYFNNELFIEVIRNEIEYIWGFVEDLDTIK